jgi:uncharacterized membrane protein
MSEAQEVEVILAPRARSREPISDRMLRVTRRLARRRDLRDEATRFHVKGFDPETESVEDIDILRDQLITRKQIVRMNATHTRARSGIRMRRLRRRTPNCGQISNRRRGSAVPALPSAWRKRFLLAELLLAAALTAGFVLWGETSAGSRRIGLALAGDRASFYGVLATVWGALLGFIITTVSIVLAFSQSESLPVVRESRHYPDLWKTFMAAIRALAISTLASLVALLVDKDAPAGHPDRFAFYAVVATSVLAVLRLLRSVWILEKVVGLVTGFGRRTRNP